MAMVCVSGAEECTGCGKCAPEEICNSCQVAIGRGQEYYSGTFGVICAECSEETESETETVCSLCGERVIRGERAVKMPALLLCGECAERCIR